MSKLVKLDQEKIGKDSDFIMFESGVRHFQSYAGASSLSGGLSHPVIAFQTKEARDAVLDMILEVPFHKDLPSTVLFADFVDGEVRAPLNNTTQWTVGKGKQPKYVVL